MKSVVLVVDDEPLQRDIMQTILVQEGYEVHTAASAEEALALFRKVRADVILTDLRMAGMDGIALLESLPDTTVPPAVIIITAHGTIASAVEAVKRGAFDYLTKPLDKAKIVLAVRKAGEHVAVLKENQRLRRELFDRFGLEGIIARSPRMKEVVEILKRVAASPATVMIRGESGTGKELVARALHYNSPRRTRPFVAINCAAIPETLFESELFGYEPGAFTGANSRREGLFELSNGGTLFLDEVGDLPMTMQSKLLRVLQDREIRRIGGKESIKVDVRIVTATNKNLELELDKGGFREDLYYRLNVVHVALPPLRERTEDIPLLIEHFLGKFNTDFGKRITEVRPDAVKTLLQYRWPGNVRQLESVIERAILLSDGPAITFADVQSYLYPGRSEATGSFDLPDEGIDLEQLERALIQKALTRTGGVASKAARLLSLNYKAFLYRMEKYGIRAAEDAEEQG